jgi:riboflavin biosynthesis pyrimidine reductase
MSRIIAKFAPLETLIESRRGTRLPLPSLLARLYGELRMPTHRGRAHIYSNFVSTLDGIVSLGAPGHAGGGDISGFNARDRMVMGLLRATADVVIVGSRNLSADKRSTWTAEAICPELAREYRMLRAALGLAASPVNVIVSGSGKLNLRLPVFASGQVPVLILTTSSGERWLRRKRIPATAEIRAIGRGAGAIPAARILSAVNQFARARRVLIEGGPRLLGGFCAAGLIDEQFLTLAPQIAGRRVGDRRLSLVMGTTFAPKRPLWGTLVDARRGDGHLFLRYTFGTSFPHATVPLATG